MRRGLGCAVQASRGGPGRRNSPVLPRSRASVPVPYPIRVPEPIDVVAVHRYFWPDTPPYAAFLRAIAARWAADGAAVRVLAAQPSYIPGQDKRARAERIDGFELERLPAIGKRTAWAKLVDLVAFPAVAATRVLTSRHAPDVVMCSTVPQVSLGVALATASRARGATFIYHCMDLHPEIGRLSGEFANPLVYRVLSRLDRLTMRLAGRVVVLSEDMKAAVAARDPRLADKVVVLNNFSLPSYEPLSEAPLPPPADGVTRVVFTGNLGRFQGLDMLIAALEDVPAHTPIELVFMGEGKAKAALEQQARDLGDAIHQVVFVPHGLVAAAKALMASAHAGVVSLVPEVVRYAYPSKTATYAEAGLPMIVIVEEGSELARTTREAGLGWSVAPGDRPGFAAALRDVAAERESGRLASRREVVSGYAHDEFAPETVLDRWSALLADIAAERKGA